MSKSQAVRFYTQPELRGALALIRLGVDDDLALSESVGNLLSYFCKDCLVFVSKQESASILSTLYDVESYFESLESYSDELNRVLQVLISAFIDLQQYAETL